jgi:hypothetical protein
MGALVAAATILIKGDVHWGIPTAHPEPNAIAPRLTDNHRPFAANRFTPP